MIIVRMEEKKKSKRNRFWWLFAWSEWVESFKRGTIKLSSWRNLQGTTVRIINTKKFNYSNEEQNRDSTGIIVCTIKQFPIDLR